MTISYNWLKDYLECDLSPEAIAEALTSIGLEVDSLEQVEEIPGGLAGVIVAEVIECVEHPDSDHLHITKLNTGAPELLQVVCGAPNVAAGQKVLLATVGTVLGEDFKIKKSKIRGVESFGMICAEDELGIGESHDGIMVLEPEACQEHLQRSISALQLTLSSRSDLLLTAWTQLHTSVWQETSTLTSSTTVCLASSICLMYQHLLKVRVRLSL